MSRIRAVWTGFVGAPGVSTFYSLSPSADLPLLHLFFDTIKTYLPQSVTVSLEGSGDNIDETSGDLLSGWTADTPTPVTGMWTGGYSAPAGAVVIWETGVVMDAHRLRGKTYLVPLGSQFFDGTGSPEIDALNLLRGAASSLAADNQLVVWHRPRAARAADGSKPAVTARAGGYASFSGSTVHDVAAILTSRRD